MSKRARRLQALIARETKLIDVLAGIHKDTDLTYRRDVASTLDVTQREISVILKRGMDDGH